MPPKIILTVAVCLLQACSPRAFALNPSLDISQYAHTAWKVRDGFIKGQVFAMAQTQDGYLWLGTEFGLFCFDGVRAMPWYPPDGQQLASSFVVDLLVARDGTLWIGTLNGIASWKEGKFTQYPEVAGAHAGSFLEDRDGKFWFGTFETSDRKARLCTGLNGMIECQETGNFARGITALYQDHQGNLWVASETGLWRWAPGRPQRYEFPRGVLEANSLVEDESGALLVATNEGVKQVSDGRIHDYPLRGLPRDVRPLHFLRDADGSLWTATAQGILRLHHGTIHRFSATNGLSDDAVNRIFKDREGNVWAGTQSGLDRFREYAFPTISQSQGLSGAGVWSVQATPDGSIWIGTAEGINRWANGHMTLYRSRSALGRDRQGSQKELDTIRPTREILHSGLAGAPESLGVDDSGRLWTATNEGVFYFELERFVRFPGISIRGIFSIASDGQGHVWILDGLAGILYRASKAGVQQVSLSQLGQGVARTLLPDQREGGVWIGFYGGGVTHLKDGKALASYSAADGMGSGMVNHLRFGSRGELWVSTEGGLSRIYDGHIATLAGNNGLPCNTVHWSMEDNDHAAWLYMPCGLVRIQQPELDAWASDPKRVIKTTNFDASDGLRSIAVYGSFAPHAAKSSDGRIWFLPRDGVTVIDPHHLPFNKLPPPVHIEQITADGIAYDPSRGPRLPAGVRNLAIDYTALSFVVPEKVRFRYILQGQDPDWREGGSDRRVEYSNLAPGSYRFRVAACNNSGVWNEDGATVDFSIAPAFHQTAWFRALCVAVSLAFLWSVYQLRRRQLQYQFNMRLETRVNERTRIARELHDTLLQSFHGLMFRFQAARNMLPGRPEEASQALDGAILRAEQAIAESRSAIQNLRSTAGDQADLVQALTAIGHDLIAQNGDRDAPHFRVIVEGERRKLSRAFQEEVYRMGRELLQNAFKHARAKEIEAEIRYERQTFRLLIRDEGKGIDAKVLKQGGRPGHWGLTGVRERAQQIGARLDFWSEAGAGTEIELTAPANVAYEQFPDGSRFHLFRKRTINEHHS
ncbi:MAG TPA: two-component regulator propeller domain-containing protein [Candidatus Angelobacter sp.]|nr:two-component regulator propeller domain-containing protein [Candidatus Angelobacter sp.]